MFQAATFLLVLLWFAFYGGFVSNLRHRLRNQHKELEAARAKIEKQAHVDELTQLYNRRHARSVMNEEMRKAENSAHVFSIAMIDIDHFKQINDRYGHDVGDEVLRQFSDLCTKLLRAGDAVAIPDTTLARYGGEEFIIVLPETDVRQAVACIDRLRAAMETLRIPLLSDPLTFSAGVAQYLPGELIDPLLKRTDEALYRAKAEGRNRIYASLLDGGEFKLESSLAI
jgi:diguanylate cyclase (GGDEF)-like protein